MTEKELFLKCAEECGITIGDYTITKISDYNQAIRFFSKLRENKVMLGMDMASLTCSGDVEVIGVPPYDICLVEKDNKCKDFFKFKAMIIINTDISDPDSSPEIFIESDEDVDWVRKNSENGYSYLRDGRYLGLEIKESGEIVYDKKRIDDYLDIQEESYYDSEVVVPEFGRVYRNTKRELLVYIDVQECIKRHDGDMILFKFHDSTCDEIADGFSKRYKCC